MNAERPGRRRQPILAAAVAVVLGVYAFAARSGMFESLSSGRRETYYNLLVRSLAAGRLDLDRRIPPGFARLSDPYDPVANAPFRFAQDGLHDLSYYQGRLYLYFGISPALVLFAPVAGLTGHYLRHREAAAIFCFLGFLVGLGLWRSAQRRYFPAAGWASLLAGPILLGLATGEPILLARSDVYEVAIACGFFFTMLTLAAIWLALHESRRRLAWMAAAGAAFGLALGARPSLLPGALCLAIPLFDRSPGISPRIVSCVVWTLAPLLLIGLGLLAYNAARFGDPWEFGQHYQLAAERAAAGSHFSLRYLAYDFRQYFLQPVPLTRHFPFLGRDAAAGRPAGHAVPEDPFGLAVDVPVLWFVAALPLLWRRSSAGTPPRGVRNRARESVARAAPTDGSESRPYPLQLFVLAVGLTALASAVTLCLFYGTCSRYEMEFLPELGLLAAIGILVFERALTGRRPWAGLARALVAILLAASVAFNGLAAVTHRAQTDTDLGLALSQAGRNDEAIEVLGHAVRLDPDLSGARINLGSALAQTRRLPEAIGQFSAAVRIDPKNFSAWADLGNALAKSGRFADAIDPYRRALAIEPGHADVCFDLGLALEATGPANEAEAQFAAALRLDPNRAEAHYRLGNDLGNDGRVAEAMEEYRAALRIQPGFPEARANLGLALVQIGRIDEAIAELEQALREKPDYPDAEAYLGLALARAGRWSEAILHDERALQGDPSNADVRYNLVLARRALGR